MKLLDLPANLHRVDDHFARQMSSEVVGNNPFHVAVRGDQLEELSPKGHLLPPHFYPPAGGSSVSRAWYPVSLLALTNRLLFKVVKKVQPAR